MKKSLLTACLALCMSAAVAQNPFFEEWTTPTNEFGVPPFSTIENAHYVPAFEKAIAQHKAEITKIAEAKTKPTFANTILAYDQAGGLLNKVSSVFFCIVGTEMTPELEVLQGQISPMLTAHSSDISLNEKLFKRIKTVWEHRAQLDSMQARLTDKIYKSFERNGANLSADQKAKLRQIDQQLSALSLSFGNNLRRDNGAFVLLLNTQGDLDGLPASVVASALTEARSRGLDGWAFTLDKASMIPFLQYSTRRDLREKLYKGYLERCNHNEANDNKKVIDQITALRVERANLMGFSSHAAFVLDRTMAKSPDRVNALLTELWDPAVALAKKEMAEMMALQGAPQDFQSWDWWFWAEKLRKAKYDLNEAELRPYFPLNAVRDGIFDLTTQLWGISYKALDSIEKYNPENQVFSVYDADSSLLGVLYLDFHPRAGKRVGAWCTSFRGQSYQEGEKIVPIVSIVCNFTKPSSPDEPALLNLDEVETFFHEFGHGLHSLFGDVPYKGLRGVERDFVELPSQIMENWAFEPLVLATYARHYQTGEKLPEALAAKIAASALFNQGFMTVEYLGASILDMDFHTLTAPMTLDVAQFEANSLGRMGIMPQIAPRYRSTYFQHIFSGGYSSGYYSYIWAEVLDADAYEAFKETGDLFDSETAKKFRDEVLSKGGTADGDVLYRNFRGKDAVKEPLMKKRGLL